MDEAYLRNFQRRVIQDALNESRAVYWLRRAQKLEEARLKPGDYTGRATPEQLQERDAQLAASAQACRNHAALIRRLP